MVIWIYIWKDQQILFRLKFKIIDDVYLSNRNYGAKSATATISTINNEVIKVKIKSNSEISSPLTIKVSSKVDPVTIESNDLLIAVMNGILQLVFDILILMINYATILLK